MHSAVEVLCKWLIFLDVLPHAKGRASAVLGHSLVEVDSCADVHLPVCLARDDVDDMRLLLCSCCSCLVTSGGDAVAAVSFAAPLAAFSCRLL